MEGQPENGLCVQCVVFIQGLHLFLEDGVQHLIFDVLRELSFVRPDCDQNREGVRQDIDPHLPFLNFLEISLDAILVRSDVKVLKYSISDFTLIESVEYDILDDLVELERDLHVLVGSDLIDT